MVSVILLLYSFSKLKNRNYFIGSYNNFFNKTREKTEKKFFLSEILKNFKLFFLWYRPSIKHLLEFQ